MNLQQSDAELRFQMQQIDAAGTPRGEGSPNPFAAVLGIAIVVLLVWIAFALGPMVERLFALAGTIFALSLF